MPLRLRFALPLLLASSLLAACGGRAVEEAPPPSMMDANSSFSVADDTDLEMLATTFREAESQAEIDNRVGVARARGYDDVQIAEALGRAWLLSPRARVVYSVSYVRFKASSNVPVAELDAAHEVGRTPLMLREENNVPALVQDTTEEQQIIVEEAEEDEQDSAEEDDEDRGGWFDWIPGF